MDIKTQTYQLIDDLKSVCHNYGMGNDGNEYKLSLIHISEPTRPY